MNSLFQTHRRPVQWLHITNCSIFIYRRGHAWSTPTGSRQLQTARPPSTGPPPGNICGVPLLLLRLSFPPGARHLFPPHPFPITYLYEQIFFSCLFVPYLKHHSQSPTSSRFPIPPPLQTRVFSNAELPWGTGSLNIRSKNTPWAREKEHANSSGSWHSAGKS